MDKNDITAMKFIDLSSLSFEELINSLKDLNDIVRENRILW